MYTTYTFYKLYLNIDEFQYADVAIRINEIAEVDYWILSRSNSLVLSEVNFEEIEYITDDSGLIRKEAKLNLKTLGKLVNRIQNIRKASDFEVTDRIIIRVKRDAALADAIAYYGDYICQETLADKLETTDAAPAGAETLELVDDIVAELAVVRV